MVPVGEDFTQKVVSNVKSITQPMQEHTQKASKRNKNTAALQLQLWNSGAFNGVIDKKTGKQITYERAVDGIMGRMTRQAMENSKKKRDNIQINIPKEQSQIQTTDNSSFLNKIPLFRQDSKNANLEAIFDNQRNRLIKNNYGVVDKQNATFSIYNGDSLVHQIPIVLGKNKGDGLASGKWNSESSGTTGAGVYKVFIGEGPDHYMSKENMLQLMSDDDDPNKYSRVSLHSPASFRRLQGLKLPANQRRMSNGCFMGKCGDSQYIVDKKLLKNDDTVYVLPEIEGNSLIEKNGKIQMQWGPNNPETYIDSKGNTRKFRYNNRKV